MNPVKTIYWGIINSAFGLPYYNSILLPKLLAASEDWKQKNKNSNNIWSQNSKKKACILISYDIDDIADIDKLPKLLRLLKKYDIKASFAAIGILVEKDPKMFKDIINAGHEIINHTYSHPNSIELGTDKHFDKINPVQRFLEIKKCHDTVYKLLDYKMVGFRIPHFGNQFVDDIYPMLRQLGYKYSSSTVAVRTITAGFPYSVRDVWEFPLTCCPKHPFCIFDTSHAFRSKLSKHNPKEYISTFESVIEFGIKNNLFINLYHDPQDIDKLDYDKILHIIDSHRKDLLICTYKELTDSINTITKPGKKRQLQ